MTAARFSLLLVSRVELRSRVRSPVALQAQLNRLWHMGVRDSSFKSEAEIVATKGFVDEPIKALLRGKALTALDNACLCWFVVGGLWTCAAFEAAGSDINPSCLLCVVSSCQGAAGGQTMVFSRGMVARRESLDRWVPTGGVENASCFRKAQSTWTGRARTRPTGAWPGLVCPTAGKSSRLHTATCQLTSRSLQRRRSTGLSSSLSSCSKKAFTSFLTASHLLGSRHDMGLTAPHRSQEGLWRDERCGLQAWREFGSG